MRVFIHLIIYSFINSFNLFLPLPLEAAAGYVQLPRCPTPQQCFSAPSRGFWGTNRLDEIYNLSSLSASLPWVLLPVGHVQKTSNERHPGGLLSRYPSHLNLPSSISSNLNSLQMFELFKETYFGHFYPISNILAHHPELMTILENMNIEWQVN